MTHGTIYDPIRQKDVPDTPEERVRQATIKFLIETVKVPENLIAVEFALSTVEPSTDDRVDLLVQDFKAAGDLKHPWLLVECKAPGEYSWQALQNRSFLYRSRLWHFHILPVIPEQSRVLLYF